MSDDNNRLYRQNEDQFAMIHANTARISAIEANHQALKVDLVGVTGNNGFRGEFRQFRTQQEKREQAMVDMIQGVSTKLEEMDKARDESKKWMVRVALGLPSAVAAAGGIIVATVKYVI